MKCAIMQPHYFPWSGYFNLISKVDKFIFLDDVQFSKNSWQSRNQILVKDKKKWITIPTKNSKLNTNINEIEITPLQCLCELIDNSINWQIKQSKTIIQSYSRCHYVKDLNDLIEYFVSLKEKNLSDFNIKIVKFISSKLDIKTDFINSSIFKITKDRTDKVIEILELINADEYLSPVGAKNYLDDDGFEKLTNIRLKINNYKCKSYPQVGRVNFISNLSLIDLIANLGWTETSKHVKDG